MAIIKTMALTSMHNNSHLEFHTSVVRSIQQAAFTNQSFVDLYNSYLAELDIEQKVIGRPRASVLTPDVEGGRYDRDGEFVHYIGTIRSARRSSIPEKKIAAEKLWIISKPYKDIYAKFMADSTDKMRVLLSIIAQDENASYIEALTLGACVQKMRQLNNKFSDTYQKRAVERGSLPAKDISSIEQRRVVDKIYKDIVAMLNSVVITTRSGIETGFDSTKLDALTVDINSFIDQYKLAIANYAKKQKKEDEESMEEEIEKKEIEIANE